jgi:hypothetical protein
MTRHGTSPWGEVVPIHPIPAEQRRVARDYERLCAEHEGRPYIAPERIARAFDDEGMIEAFRERDSFPTTFERVADALGSRDFLLVYAGIWLGCLLTVVLAYCWSVVL